MTGSLYLLARHGESTMNAARCVNGDPARPVGLTKLGEREAALLAEQVRNVPIELCVHSRFERTRRTAERALAGRHVPMRQEPLLDDIDVGELEGSPIEEYHAWKEAHGTGVPFPGGESLEDAARRYARAFRRLAAERRRVVLVVCHELTLRYLLNAADGSDHLSGPIHELANATPYLFDEEAILRAADRIELLVDRSRLRS